MICMRCHGRMTYERFLDVTQGDYAGWRCINCGDIRDHLILKNRLGPLGPARWRNQPRSMS
jgi:hypothetical protein